MEDIKPNFCLELERSEPAKDFKNIKLPSINLGKSAIIEVPQFDKKMVDTANHYADSGKFGGVILNVKNTVGITKELLNLLHDGIGIRIAQGFDADTFVQSWDENYYDDENGTNQESGFEIYFLGQIYSKKEMLGIIKELERLESNVSNLSETQKAKKLYDNICKYFCYSYKGDMESSEIRSLRALLTKHGVCSAFSMVYKELCDRNGINCKYHEGFYKNDRSDGDGDGHAFNTISIKGKNYLVDPTMGLLRDLGSKSFRSFAIGKERLKFYKSITDESFRETKFTSPSFKWRLNLDKSIYGKQDPFKISKKFGKNIDTKNIAKAELQDSEPIIELDSDLEQTIN